MRGLVVASALGILLAPPLLAAGRGEPGVVFPMRVPLHDRLADLMLLHDLDIDVDGVYGTWARVYVLPEEIEKLAGLGFDLSPIPEEVVPAAEMPLTPSAPPTVPTTYHTYETLTSELQQIANAHP